VRDVLVVLVIEVVPFVVVDVFVLIVARRDAF